MFSEKILITAGVDFVCQKIFCPPDILKLFLNLGVKVMKRWDSPLLCNLFFKDLTQTGGEPG